MTICVAALAANSRAVVCVADKALSYGSSIQWDSDSSKMLTLNPSGAVVMFAGGEEGCSRVLGGLLEAEEELGKNAKATARRIEAIYKDSLDELCEKKFLAPRLLPREAYLSAITATQLNPYMKKIANDIDGFDMDCSLLVCGRSESSKQCYLLDVYHPGIVTDMTRTGHVAIGSGYEKSLSRLLFSEHKREHEIGRVLYDAFDAKAFAELSEGVGYEWDAKVMLGGKLGSHDVPKEIKDLIERAWAKFNRSPFEKYNPKEDLKLPPGDWRDQIDEWVSSAILSTLPNAVIRKEGKASSG